VRSTRTLFKSPGLIIEATKQVSYSYVLGGKRVWFSQLTLFQCVESLLSFTTIDAGTRLRLTAFREKLRRKPKTVKPKGLVERRSHHADKQLKTIQHKIKRLKTAEKKWKKKVQYYRKKKEHKT